VTAEDFGGLNGQRAVQINRHILGEPSVFGKKVEGVKDFLGSLHSEGRNDYFLLAGIAEGDGLGQFVQTLGFIFVVPVPIGRFQKEVIRQPDLARVYNLVCRLSLCSLWLCRLA
jgi:hypothetical protein